MKKREAIMKNRKMGIHILTFFFITLINANYAISQHALVSAGKMLR
ncbi:Uncharacterized protein dnm_033070 [Desulfonema magnum]|uniref:Uncharacterized protein n=1 Tax=Desulfonema magnum TaxID=45655 RepID=A0A975BKK3_9BACT|nr:Uncharacterized protein dnm_033070 [Desulfonema magnum]